jgi:hypothetical protein
MASTSQLLNCKCSIIARPIKPVAPTTAIFIAAPQ